MERELSPTVLNKMQNEALLLLSEFYRAVTTSLNWDRRTYREKSEGKIEITPEEHIVIWEMWNSVLADALACVTKK